MIHKSEILDLWISPLKFPTPHPAPLIMYCLPNIGGRDSSSHPWASVMAHACTAPNLDNLHQFSRNPAKPQLDLKFLRLPTSPSPRGILSRTFGFSLRLNLLINLRFLLNFYIHISFWFLKTLFLLCLDLNFHEGVPITVWGQLRVKLVKKARGFFFNETVSPKICPSKVSAPPLQWYCSSGLITKCKNR
jgi:hypothetical protein